MENVNIDNFKTVKEIEDYRKSINEACDNRLKIVTMSNRALNLSKKSFLFIKESFESMAPELFLTTEGKKLINRYKSIIKSSQNLKSMHSLCENIRKANKDVDVDFFVKNITDVDWNVDNNTLSEDIEKLGRVLGEGYILLGDNAEKFIVSENTALDNSIKFIATNKKTSKNISEYSTAAKIIRENIEKIESDGNIFESRNFDEVANELIESFNKKYSTELSEDEAELIKEIASNNDRKTIFENRKGICLGKLDEAILKSESNNEKARLEKIREQVSNKQYNEQTFGDDVLNLLTMSSVIG